MARLRRHDFLSEDDFQDWLLFERQLLNEPRRRKKAWWQKKPSKRNKRKHSGYEDLADEE